LRQTNNSKWFNKCSDRSGSLSKRRVVSVTWALRDLLLCIFLGHFFNFWTDEARHFKFHP